MKKDDIINNPEPASENGLRIPLGKILFVLKVSCLIKNIRTHIENIKSKSIKEQLALARPYKNDTNFIEGIDYDMENGLLVMSRWTHLKRGKCCGNGCRHCPYT